MSETTMFWSFTKSWIWQQSWNCVQCHLQILQSKAELTQKDFVVHYPEVDPRFHPQVLLGFFSENFYPVFNPNIEHIIFWPCLDPLHNVQNNHNPVFNPNHNVQKIFCTKGPNIFTRKVIQWSAIIVLMIVVQESLSLQV